MYIMSEKLLENRNKTTKPRVSIYSLPENEYTSKINIGLNLTIPLTNDVIVVRAITTKHHVTYVQVCTYPIAEFISETQEVH